MIGKLIVQSLMKKIRPERLWNKHQTVSKGKKKSCDELYFTGNERIKISEVHTNDLANVQLVILEYYGDPRMLYKQAHYNEA